MEKDRNFDTDNRRKLKPWHGLLLWNCNGIFLYDYCMGTDEMGNV